jgi:hypothetical protein
MANVDSVARHLLAPVVIAVIMASPSPAGASPAPASAPPAPAGATPFLLPVPAAAPGQRISVTAVDVSPSGVVAGNAHVTPDGTDIPLRWTGRLRQRVALPAGATGGTLTGVTDRGEVAGAVTIDGGSRAARWSANGRHVTLLGDAGSRVSAVGPRGPWGVFTGTGDILNSGNSELVTRAGARTPLTGTPDLAAGYRRIVASIAGPATALVWVVDGIGRATAARPVLWQAGATHLLPVIDSAFAGPACVSRVLADGSVAASGYSVAAGTVSYVLVRHTGGVPGTDVVLNRASGAGPPVAGLTCGDTRIAANLAPDGGVAGFVSDATGQHAAYWNAAGEITQVPLAPGELSATGVLAASHARMVIRSQLTDGTTTLSLWHDGARTPIRLPAGWTLTSVVELTERGLLIANLQDTSGTVRPAAWHL